MVLSKCPKKMLLAFVGEFTMLAAVVLGTTGCGEPVGRVKVAANISIGSLCKAIEDADNTEDERKAILELYETAAANRLRANLVLLDSRTGNALREDAYMNVPVGQIRATLEVMKGDQLLGVARWNPKSVHNLVLLRPPFK